MMKLAVFLVLGSISLSHQGQSFGKCPEQDGPTPTYYIDPTNCSRFYECNHGYPFLISCPPYTVFDTSKNVCVHSPDGKCLPEIELEDELASNLEPDFTLSSILLPDDLLKDGPSLATKCPAVDGQWPTYLIDPNSCSRFYECAHGVPYLKECLPGLDFDPARLVCDLPSQAGCRNKKVLSASEYRYHGPSLSTKCPRRDGLYPTFILHPTDCSKYYECSNGVPYLYVCPPGLRFNPVLLTCDNREKVQCPRDSLDDISDSDEVKLEQADDNEYKDGPSLATKCPSEDGRYPTFLIDPTNCSRYYECAHGHPFLNVCPQGLEFDASRLVCDLPSEANCHLP